VGGGQDGAERIGTGDGIATHGRSFRGLEVSSRCI
jgi:hypothetical protein